MCKVDFVKKFYSFFLLSFVLTSCDNYPTSHKGEQISCNYSYNNEDTILVEFSTYSNNDFDDQPDGEYKIIIKNNLNVRIDSEKWRQEVENYMGREVSKGEFLLDFAPSFFDDFRRDRKIKNDLIELNYIKEKSNFSPTSNSKTKIINVDLYPILENYHSGIDVWGIDAITYTSTCIIEDIQPLK